MRILQIVQRWIPRRIALLSWWMTSNWIFWPPAINLGRENQEGATEPSTTPWFALFNYLHVCETNRHSQVSSFISLLKSSFLNPSWSPAPAPSTSPTRTTRSSSSTTTPRTPSVYTISSLLSERNCTPFFLLFRFWRVVDQQGIQRDAVWKNIIAYRVSTDW